MSRALRARWPTRVPRASLAKEAGERREGQYDEYDRATRAQPPAASDVSRRRSRASLGRSRRRRGTRARLLVLNQYYWPGVEATAYLLHDLCRQLQAEFEVTVVTGMIPHRDSIAGTTVKDGVTIVRVNSTSFDRRRLSRRGLNYVSYLGLSLLAALRAEKPDVVLCMTDPPIIADIALVVARRFRAPLVVISQDVFPEIAVELHRLENPLVVAFLRELIGVYLKRADRVVAIGETMRDRLEAKGASRERIRVIPNWVDTRAITPMPRDNAWAREHGLAGKFVVMHSGNIGHAQNLDALVRSATFLRDLDDLAIVIIGGGARHRELEHLTELLEVPIKYLPYQPRELLSQSLSAADIHVVGLAKGLSGFVVPSRLYGILAAGRPVIVAAELASETVQLVERVQCGVVVPPGRPEQLALAIRDAHDAKFDLVEMARRGREYVVAEADRVVAFRRYADLLHELVA